MNPCTVFWCDGDHEKTPTHVAHVGQTQVGPDPLDVVIVRIVASSAIAPSVAVLPLKRSPIPVHGLLLKPEDALSLAHVFEVTGQMHLASLVREAADILADREKESP